MPATSPSSGTGPDPLPPHVDLVRVFANTLDVEDATDAVSTPDGLRAWLRARDLLPADAAVGAADVALAVRFRDELRSALRGPTDLAASSATADLPVQVRIDSGTPQVAPAGSGVPGALAAVAVAAAICARTGDWERLRPCAAADCQWVFYDSSRNRSRHWCAMGVCGNRTKTRTYRARQRAR